MFKVTPNPPDIDSVLYGDSLDPEKLKEAADRALKHYLNPGATKTQIQPHPHNKRVSKHYKVSCFFCSATRPMQARQ
ncbi:hypothetical protein D3C78_1077900 [compost metagenome]